MEVVELRYMAMQQALLTLEEGIEEIEIPIPGRPKAYTLMRDGVTQRFEYCIDSFWKFFKIYFETVKKVSIESSAPRAILRLTLDSKLITDDECDTLLDCLSDRNLTSHTYDEGMAETIQRLIPFYHVTMKAIIDRLENDIKATRDISDKI